MEGEKTMNNKIISIFFAFIAAMLYALNIPFSKLLLEQISPVFMASFLYFGAGIGMLCLSLLKKGNKEQNKLTKKELPYTLGMIFLDILAPISLMFGLKWISPTNASLLNNFEIVATSCIALFFFQEKISSKMWAAILLITLSSVLLSLDEQTNLSFSYGAIFILLACIFWCMENNCTRMLSSKNIVQIVVLKGICSGFGSFIVAFVIGEHLPHFFLILIILILGFLSYGLSIFFYVKAQKELGAAKTSAYYSINPFIGTFLSFLIFQEKLSKYYFLALFIMILGTILVILDTLFIKHKHIHSHQSLTEHTHEHIHFVTNLEKHIHKH